MNVDARIIVAALHRVWTLDCQSGEGPTRLRDALISRSGVLFDQVSTGGIKAVTANGRSTVFADAGIGQLTPMETLTVWEYLVELFDRAVGDLGGSPTDLQVEVRMESYIRPITNYTTDFTHLFK